MPSDTAELILAGLLGIVAVHAVLGAGAAGIAAGFGGDLTTKSHWAKPLALLTVATAAVSLLVFAVRLGWLLVDAGGYDFDSKHHSATLLGLIAAPVAVVTAIASQLVARRRHATAGLANRYLTGWAVGVLTVAVFAGPALVVLSFFPPGT